MKLRELSRETWVKQDPTTVFNFFADPDNLLKVTPDSIPVSLLTPTPIEMGEGTVLDLKMKLFRFFPVKWQTRIDVWDPPTEFVDSQPKGPYRYWKHVHRFIPKDGGTLIVDHVTYAVPGFLVEPLVHKLAVERNLKELFDHRQKMYQQFLG